MPTASLIDLVRTAAPASTLSGSRAGPSSPSQTSSSPICSAYWRNSTMCWAGADGNNHTPVFGGTVCEDYTARPATTAGLEGGEHGVDPDDPARGSYRDAERGLRLAGQ